MQRTNIYLDDTTLRSLKVLAAARGISMSDIVREAIDSLMAQARTRGWSDDVRRLLKDIEARKLAPLSEEDAVEEVRSYRRERQAARKT